MVKGLPEQYVFFLLPCYETDCVHPVCQRGRPDVEMTWFEGGPSLPEIPFPVPVYSFRRPEKSSRNYVLPRGVEEAMIVSSIL